MRLDNYLIEDKNIDRLVNKISKECSEYIEIIKKTKKPLLRGVKNLVTDFIKRVPRKDRIPKDTNIEIQKMLDDIFEMQCGWRPRSEGVFAVSTYHTADFYGNVYFFFPVNGYEYIWSPVIRDLYETKFNSGEFDGALNMHTLYKGYYLSYDKDKRIKAHLESMVDTYKNTDLVEAIRLEHEVMFKCKEYYLLNHYKYKYMFNDL